MRHPNILDRKNAVLFIIDVQEKFREHISDFDQLCHNIAVLVQAVKILGVPVVVTEQYPKGLGKTVPAIAEPLKELHKYQYFEKSCFSGFEDPELVHWLKDSGRKQVIMTGIETHVCVNQTSHDLLMREYQVHLVKDAVASRTHANKEVGVEKIVTAGGIPTSVEALLFEMLVESGTEDFKAVQKLVK